MKFGIPIPKPDPRFGQAAYRKMYEACELAEEYGFDFACVSNHRFSDSALDPSAPFVVMGALAARTTTLNFLTTIILLPLYNPIDIAEQVATVDVLSGGRVTLGIGVGYRPYEFEALGLSFAARGSRTDEAIAVLRGAWSGQPFTFEGRHFSIHDLTVVPRPHRPGGPEIWVGAQRWAAIERGARLGDGWIVGWQEDLPALQKRVPRYREAAAANGRHATVCLMRKVGIRATRREVEADWLPGAVEGFRHYARHGSRYRGSSPLYDALDTGSELSLSGLGQGQFVAGNPDDCIRDIQLFHDATGCEWFQASFSSGLVADVTERDYDELIDSIKLFGREVIPAFRKHDEPVKPAQ